MQKNINKDLKKLIIRICELSCSSNEGHVPSALSILDIVWVVYNKILNQKLLGLNSYKRDYFILSKGHGCLAQYVVLEDKKIIKTKDLNSFCKYNSKFGGHPDSNKIKGVEASTGSLGHGFPFAAGIAYANKIRKIKNRTIVLVGDGESNEGTVWETCMLAAHHKLNNLVCIIDNNQSTLRSLKMTNLKNKFKSFDWETKEVDGHNQSLLYKAIKFKSAKPLAIIANTTKGKGLDFMEKNHYEWHHKKIDSELLNEIKKKLNKK
jgi:transketolase